jgi:hypothetical protein
VEPQPSDASCVKESPNRRILGRPGGLGGVAVVGVVMVLV